MIPTMSIHRDNAILALRIFVKHLRELHKMTRREKGANDPKTISWRAHEDLLELALSLIVGKGIAFKQAACGPAMKRIGRALAVQDRFTSEESARYTEYSPLRQLERLQFAAIVETGRVWQIVDFYACEAESEYGHDDFRTLAARSAAQMIGFGASIVRGRGIAFNEESRVNTLNFFWRASGAVSSASKMSKDELMDRDVARWFAPFRQPPYPQPGPIAPESTPQLRKGAELDHTSRN